MAMSILFATGTDIVVVLYTPEWKTETGQQQITLLKRPVSGLTTTTAMEKNKNKDEMKTTATKRKTKSGTDIVVVLYTPEWKTFPKQAV
jgi:ABC-type proline/glycine betaine transport system substrate-binding protein